MWGGLRAELRLGKEGLAHQGDAGGGCPSPLPAGEALTLSWQLSGHGPSVAPHWREGQSCELCICVHAFVCDVCDLCDVCDIYVMCDVCDVFDVCVLYVCVMCVMCV